ncbi:MAG: hypothetical protein CMO97_01680 [Woeseia sp.]|nr:hypothetical protein [Woeseia sp.]
MQISKNIYSSMALKHSTLSDPLDNKKATSEAFSEVFRTGKVQQKVNSQDQIPAWVNKDYHYDPSNPRKPNMRELMEALSGMNLTELYADPNSNWQELSKYASETLYGVTAGNEDSRDWNLIMNSNNIPNAIRKETNSMHQPTVAIVSERDESDKIKSQHAVIKDKSGKILRAISGDSISIQRTLENFGSDSKSIPLDIEQKITDPAFDQVIVSALNEFRENNNNSNLVDSIGIEIIARSINNSLSELTILENES